MFVGYFSYEENGEDKIGYFMKEVGHEYYLVHLFHPVEKVSEPNLAGFAHNKPQLRFVPEVFLDMRELERRLMRRVSEQPHVCVSAVERGDEPPLHRVAEHREPVGRFSMRQGAVGATSGLGA